MYSISTVSCTHRVIIAENADEELIRWGWPEDVW